MGPRLGLTDEETETVAWLVRWHLLMSGVAFKFDIGDPQTIQNFVDRVQSPERLKLLLVLTVADIRAVGPKVWNGWKAALLRELYHSAFDLISGGATAEARDSRIAAAQAEVRALLPEFTDEEFAAFVGRGYPFYWLSLDAETHARHARLMRQADRSGAPLSVETRIDPQRAVTEITLYTADHPGLFSRIAGALAVNGANIVDAKIMTMTNGMALDTFWIQDHNGEPVDRPDKLARLSVAFENVLTGDLKPHREFARPLHDFGRHIDGHPEGPGLEVWVDAKPGAQVRARRAGDPKPHQRLHRDAAGPDRQSGEPLAHVDRGQRPRPPGSTARAHPRIDPPQPASVERQDLDLRRKGRRRVLRQEPVRP